jgi:hypothetical protein
MLALSLPTTGLASQPAVSARCGSRPRLLLGRELGLQDLRDREATAAAEVMGMPEIKGTFRWDDDDLTPGQSKEGGLNHNLYGGQGKGTKGQAHFIPDEDQVEPDPRVDYTHHCAEPPASDWWQQLVADVAIVLIAAGVETAKPIVANWWIVTAVPAMKASWEDLKAMRTRRKAAKVPETAEVLIGEIVDADALTQEVATADGKMIPMTSEQYEQLVHALAAADEVRAMLLDAIEHSDVVDGEPPALAQLKELRALSPNERAKRIGDYFIANPSILEHLGRSLMQRGPLQLEPQRPARERFS